MGELVTTTYLGFPFRIDSGTGAPVVSDRSAHIREQIEQVLFTNPRERVFRPEFGTGIRMLVFEPNSRGLAEITNLRLLSSLREALHGEVDPKTLKVEVTAEEQYLYILISYTLAAIGHSETQKILIGQGN